jgi:hypothetical protein
MVLYIGAVLSLVKHKVTIDYIVITFAWHDRLRFPLFTRNVF